MTEEKKPKFYIDIKKLNKNVLCIKYNSTQNYKLSPVSINNDVKSIIIDIIKNEFNKRLYDKLNDMEKQIVVRMVDIMDYNINIQDETTDKLYNDFSILRGELMAGNDSNIVKKELKYMIMQLIDLKRIPHFKGMRMMFELSL